MSSQIVQPAYTESTDLSSARSVGLNLVTAIHATVTKIAHNGPPLDMTTQLCAVVAHVDLDVAEFFARESLRSLFRATPFSGPAQQQAA